MEVSTVPIVNEYQGLTSPSVGRITCRETDEPVPINQPVPPDDGTVRPSVMQDQHLNDVDESLSHPQPNPPSPIVAKDYKKLWKSVAKATNEGKAVRNLVDILSDEDGREFTSNLEHTDAELCIEILTNVSFNPHPHPSFVDLMVPSGRCGARPRTYSKASILSHIEEARRNPCATSGIYGSSRRY